jgi:hypothetical protein
MPVSSSLGIVDERNRPSGRPVPEAYIYAITGENNTRTVRCFSPMSWFSLCSFASILSMLSVLSLLCVGSIGSMISVGSLGSIASTSSVFSVLSVNSVLAVGCPNGGFFEVCFQKNLPPPPP